MTLEDGMKVVKEGQAHGKLTLIQWSALLGLIDARQRQTKALEETRKRLEEMTRGMDGLNADLMSVWMEIKSALDMDLGLDLQEVSFRTSDKVVFVTGAGAPAEEKK